MDLIDLVAFESRLVTYLGLVVPKVGTRTTDSVDLLALFLESTVLRECVADVIDLVALDSGLVAPLGPVVTKAGAGTTDLLALFLGLAVLKEYIYLVN